MWPKAWASIRPSVSLVSGQVSATKSASGKSALSSSILCTASAAPRPARGSPQPDDMHIEDLGEPGEASPDIAQTDDEERFAADLVLTLGEIADHSAPHPFCLIVTGLGEPAAQCEDQRHRVLRDRR